MRSLLALVLICLALLVASLPARADEGVNAVFLDGRRLTFDQAPLIVSDRAMVPLRAVLEAAGFWVNWVPGGDIEFFKFGEVSLGRMRVGDPVVEVDGRRVTLPVPPQVVGGRTLLPLVFFREAMGWRVEWAAASRHVEITRLPWGNSEPWTVEQVPAGGTGPGAVLTHPAAPDWAWQIADGRIMASQDGGATWQEAMAGLEPLGSFVLRPVRLYAFDPDPLGGVVGLPGIYAVMADTGGLWHSPTGGGEWFKVTSMFAGATIQGVTVQDGVLHVATDHGGVRPGGLPLPERTGRLAPLAPAPFTWGANRLPGLSVTAVSPDPSRPAEALIYVEGQGIFRDAAGQAELLLAREEYGLGFVRHPTVPEVVYATSPFQILRSADGGATWTALPFDGGYRRSLGNVLPDPADPGRLIFTRHSLGGTSFSYSDDLQAEQWSEGGSLWQNVRVGVEGTAIYACDMDGRCIVSRDGARTFTPHEGPLPGAVPLPEGFQLIDRQGDVWLARHAQVPLALSTDAGKTWQSIAASLPGAFRGARFGPDGRLWAFTSQGLWGPVAPTGAGRDPLDAQAPLAATEATMAFPLYLSDDGGATWRDAADLLGHPQVWQAAFGADGSLWLWTAGGLYRLA